MKFRKHLHYVYQSIIKDVDEQADEEVDRVRFGVGGPNHRSSVPVKLGCTALQNRCSHQPRTSSKPIA